MRMGYKKNKETNFGFKKIVRLLKRLRNEMAEAGNESAQQASSFLIECMVWNVPNESFKGKSYVSDIWNCLAHLFNNTRGNDDCSKWVELNDLQYLFVGNGPGTKKQAHNFVSAAWDYIGFEG